MGPDSGTVYGQVVATMGRSVFMLPMKTLVDEIKGQQDNAESQVTVVLPSPSILLTDLAQYHRHMLEDPETADIYEQAASRARDLDGSEDHPPAVRTIPVPVWTREAPESAVSQPWWEPDPALNLAHGRDTAKEHSSPIPMRSVVWPEKNVAKDSEPPASTQGDHLARYTHMEFSKRAGFYHSLHANDQRHIDAYLRRVTQIRKAMASGKLMSESLVGNILTSVKHWRNTRENRPHGKILSELSEGSVHQGSTRQQLLDYDPLMELNVTKTRYSGAAGRFKTHEDVEEDVIPLKVLLEDPARWLQREMPPRQKAHVTHIHIPATNMEVRTVGKQIWLT